LYFDSLIELIGSLKTNITFCHYCIFALMHDMTDAIIQNKHLMFTMSYSWLQESYTMTTT